MKGKPKLYERFLNLVGHHLIIFYILSFTWGVITSSIGLLLMIPFLLTKRFKTFHNRLYGIFPKCFGSGWGFEMGCFFFIAHDCDDYLDLKLHECGHGFQNILWGPLMLFVITIPSVIRFWYREYLTKKGKTLKPYESIWFESQASRLGYIYILYLYEYRKE